MKMKLNGSTDKNGGTTGNDVKKEDFWSFCTVWVPVL
jgi:hypothetical protein